MGRARALAAATLFCVGSLAAIAFGADVAVPPLDSPVMDRAELLDAPTERALVSRLLAYERQSGHQVVVHTTPSLEGLDIESYSIDVAEQWKVGHKGLDNGVIFTVAPNERKLRIEVGYGLEGVLPDIIAGQIVRDIVVPQLRGGDPSGAILSGVDAIVAAASGEVVEVPEAARRRGERSRGRGLPGWAVLVLLFLMFGSRGFFFLPFMGGLGRGGGGFGRGGGGFGGGGGGFGGGGASGSW